MNTITQNSYHCHTSDWVCNKHTYSSENAAGAVRCQRLQSKNNPPEYLRAYHCSTCNGWHLTSLRKVQNLREFTRNARKDRHQCRQLLHEFLYTESSTSKADKATGQLIFVEDNIRQVSLKSALSNQFGVF